MADIITSDSVKTSEVQATAPTSTEPQNPQVTSVSSSSNIKKKINWKKTIFAIIILVLIVLIVLVLTDVIKLKGGKGTGTTQEKLNISYSIYSGTELIDSKTNLFTKDSIASSLGFISNKIDQEINSMQAGEEKNITLEPKDAYGAYDPSLIFNYPRIDKQNRTNEMNRTMWIDKENFTLAFNEQPVLNKNYSTQSMPWPYKVIELNATHAKLSQEATLNQEIPIGVLGTYRVIELTNDKIKIKLFGNDTIIPTASGDYIINFTENEVITTLVAQLGQEVELGDLPKARVTGMNATHIFLDANNQYAGKTITMQLTLLEKKTEKITGSAIKHIEGAPLMQVFIMSHCPYGTQIVKGLLPVWQAFKDKANIELRFVSYTMHGAQEDLDNSRIICIREEQSEKLIEYLNCFVYGDGSEASSQTCIAQIAIDKTKLDSCVATKAASYYEQDKALNTQYSVQGSPTVIIDGKEAQIYPRDPQTIAKALCDVFTTNKPSVCSQTFSTTNPDPGFGGTSSSSSNSTSAGSCG